MRTTSRLVAEDAARMAAKRGNQPGARPTAVMPTRRDNILSARSDGTFEAKRLAYNQSGQATGHSMDEAGNITAPAPTAVKPGGKLIPGHSPGSSIWQPDTPASQSGQPSQSSPSVLPPALKRPAAPRPPGLIDGQPAATTLAALKTAQTQVPRQTARNAEAPPAVQLPTVASAITPAVTRNVTSPVTSPSQGPAAKALADFNAANPNVMTVAQTDALAAERRGQITDAQNTLKTQREAPHRQLQKDMMQPYAPVKQLNTGIASIDAIGPGAQITSPAQDLAEAIRPGVNAQRAQQGIPPPTAINPSQPPAPALPPAPAPLLTPEALAALGIPGRAKGGPVTAGQPYLVGEKGPEIIVPKQAGTVIPNHAIKPPAMDKLANQGKMATLPHARTPASIVSAASAGNRPADPEAAQKWLDGWARRGAAKKEAERDPEIVREEKKRGLQSLEHLRYGQPQGQMKELQVGVEEGLTKVGQTIAGLGSMVGVPGAEVLRKTYADRADTMNSYRKRGAPDLGFSGGDIASGAITQAPEWVNPISKPGQVAKAGNALYHFARGYAPDKSMMDGAIASVSNVIGEKAEDLVARGKGLVGNMVGSVTEKAANYFREPPPAAANPSRQKRQQSSPNPPPTQVITPKALATRPTAQRSHLALGN